MQRYICKLLYMFRVVFPPIIRSTLNSIYSIWHLSNRYCYLPTIVEELERRDIEQNELYLYLQIVFDLS